jgi:hypothetical protein
MRIAYTTIPKDLKTDPLTNGCPGGIACTSEEIGDWQKLLVTLAASIAEIPQLEPFRAQLSGMLAQAMDATQRQSDLLGSRFSRLALS